MDCGLRDINRNIMKTPISVIVALSIAEAFAGAFPWAMGNHSLIMNGVIPIFVMQPSEMSSSGVSLPTGRNEKENPPCWNMAKTDPAIISIVLISLKTMKT